MKPVLYLDVDGVLWDIQRRLKDDPKAVVGSDPTTFACAANGLEEFLEYVLEKFEVRWCTTWAMGGSMPEHSMLLLKEHTGVSVDTWAQVQPSLGWYDYKSENINWNEYHGGREFAWIEDDLLEEEIHTLERNGCIDNYFHTDVFEDSDALIKTLAKLKERFGK